MFATSVVPTIYSLRWQIELVFKSIKSHLGFEFILGKREARIECQLYGRLIGMVLSLFLTGQFRQHSRAGPRAALFRGDSVTLQGELTRLTIAEGRRQLDALLEGDGAVKIDLSSVTAV